MPPWYIDRVGTLSARFTADKRIPILSELYVCREFIDRVGTLSTRFTADKKIVILWGGEKIIKKNFIFAN